MEWTSDSLLPFTDTMLGLQFQSRLERVFLEFLGYFAAEKGLNS